MGTAGFGGSFAPIVQYEKWEIHPVFPHFSYFRLCQNLAPNLLAPLCGVALNSHALSQCATIYERLWRMGIYMHQHRLPRKGRGAGICLKYYCECGAFTVIFPSSRMKVSMKMRIFSPFFELHSWDERLAVQPKQNFSEVPRYTVSI